MTLDEAVALLKEIHELQPWLSQDADLAARVELALAAHEAEESVKWTPLADGKACAAEVDGYLVEVRPSYAGDGWWAWKAEQPVKHRDRQHGHKRTKELAQEAAIAAARGQK